MLSPAYDMLSTTLAMPEDTEELALTLNGKKRNLNRTDFEKSFSQSGLESKVIKNLFFCFEKVLSQWQAFVEMSFLSEEQKTKYNNIIVEKLNLLK